jgi:hypothetical protein
MNDKIKILQEQIEIEKRKINNCTHNFDKPFFNAETINEAYGYKPVYQGSDHWFEPQGFREVKKDRWTRKCKKCGFEQHTNNTKPIIEGYEPSF